MSPSTDHASLLSHCQSLLRDIWQGLSPRNLAILAHLLNNYFSYLAEQVHVDQAEISSSTGIGKSYSIPTLLPHS